MFTSSAKSSARTIGLRAASWSQIEDFVTKSGYGEKFDSLAARNDGPTSAHSRLRLFGCKDESQIRVTLYRDHHAWCPYCQKVWLFLEEKRIPYRVKKVTMFCYGEKERWFLKIVPRGMLPALELDGDVITESDQILLHLEDKFGPLNNQFLGSPEVMVNRKLERELFSAWCRWLCYPSRNDSDEAHNKENFERVVTKVERSLQSKGGPFFLGQEFGPSDIVFTPYVERMNASLWYYKGYDLRGDNPVLGRWFDAMEGREVYRGTQSDFHTHVHDLPPQMGGCYFPAGCDPGTRKYAGSPIEASVNSVDCGPWLVQGGVDGAMSAIPDVNPAARPEPASSKAEAAYRMLKHRDVLKQVNPLSEDVADVAFRAAVTEMLEEELLGNVAGPQAVDVDADAAKVALACRYLRDRINVPRDMSIWAGKRLRHSLEKVATMCDSRSSGSTSYPLPFEHRRDQNPMPFVEKALSGSSSM